MKDGDSRRAWISDPVGGHSALVGARRGAILCAIGGALLVTAAVSAACQAGRRADADFESAWLFAIAGGSFVAFGVVDLLSFRAFERGWDERGGAAWTIEPRDPADGDERRAYPRSSSEPWTWVVLGGALSMVALDAFVRTHLSPSDRVVGIFLMPATQFVIYGWRASFGVVVATASYPHDGFAVGHAASVVLCFDSSRSELTPDSFEFELECVRAKPALLGLFARREIVASVAPRVRDLTAVDRLRSTWRLEFDVPADAPVADLRGDPPVYWRLRAEAHGPRARYGSALFVPVFGD